MKQYTQQEIDVVQEHLQVVLVKLGAAIAVQHEGTKGDSETLGELLQDINLEAWRMRWQLGGAS